MYVSLYVKYQLFLSYFNGSRRFSTDLLRTVQIRNVMKIRVGAELFHSDGQTDRQTDRQRDRQTNRQTEGETGMTKLIVAFRNFANAPINAATAMQ